MRKYIGPYTGLVLFLVVFLTISGYLGQKYVRDQIREEAHKAAVSQLVADRYTLNHTACAIRAFVAPSLETSHKVLENDKSTPEQVSRAKTYIRKTERALTIWTTIPPDFDCATLPKKPPIPGPAR